MEIPKLIVASGTTETEVQSQLNSTSSTSPSPKYRGYRVSNTTSIQPITPKRPLWFVFPGVGCQWLGMGQQMLTLPLFHSKILEISQILTPYGINLDKIISEADEELFQDPINIYVAIIAIQITLIEILKSLGIEPDGYFGHSFGEIACAYTDGLLTKEQAVVASMYRGKAVEETNLDPGLMAAVGLSLEECEKRKPEDIDIACHNGSNGVTIAGPPSSIQNFVTQLKSEGKFAVILNTCNKAFHSRYIAKAGPKFLKYLSEVITETKPRSSKWTSSSVSDSSGMNSDHSADYHVNNFLNRVLFAQGLKYIPRNAIILQIGPSGPFEKLFEHEFGEGFISLSLMKPNKGVEYFLQTIGELYNLGYDPKVDIL